MPTLLKKKGKTDQSLPITSLNRTPTATASSLQDYLEEIGEQEETVTVVADGAFSGSKIDEMAAENNVTVINTNLTGKEAKDIAESIIDFKFNDDGTRVIECPNGQTTKSCSCSKKGVCTVSFHEESCEGCPYRDRCNPKEYSRTTRETISIKTKNVLKSSAKERRKNSKQCRYSAMGWKQFPTSSEDVSG